MSNSFFRFVFPLACLSGLAVPALAQDTASVSWTEKVSVGADFRLRAENQVVEGDPDRFRNRFQIRASVVGKVTDDLSTHLRLASANAANEGITTSNQTMDDASNKKPVWIDLAFIDWKAAETLSLSAGKILNPYWTAGKNQMLWDSDLTFEGAALRWNSETDNMKWIANLGGHWLSERTNAPGTAEEGADALMGGAQAGASLKGGAINGSLVLSYYSMTGLKNNAFLGKGQSGNSVSPTGGYLHDFRLLNAGVEIGTNAIGLPLTAYFEWVQNDEASDDNRGTLAGLRIGKLKEPNDWVLDYNWRTVEADAVLGTFTESDFAGGVSNSRGHRVNFQYQAAKGVVPALTYYAAETNINTAAANNERWQIDITFAY